MAPVFIYLEDIDQPKRSVQARIKLKVDFQNMYTKLGYLIARNLADNRTTLIKGHSYFTK